MADASTAPRPVILVAEPPPGPGAESVEAALGRRYAADYEILDAASDLRATIDRLSESGRTVALFLAAEPPGGDGEETAFGHVRQIFPDARRALLLDWGAWADAATAQRVLDLMSRLQIDYYVVRPSAPWDEDFHRAVTDFLRDWRAAVGGRRGVTVIGEDHAARTHILRRLLAHGGMAVTVLAPASREAAVILDAAGRTYAGVPLVRTVDGRVLVDPDDAEIARARGLTTDLPAETVDVAIVGAGPGGLAAAVYAASEGLSTLVLETEAIGGQAGSSSLIRNYLGFPRGVSGADLADRAFQQAWVFGATFAHTRSVAGLETGDPFTLTVAPGERITARAVVLATGVTYRRLTVPGLERFVGASVFYGASSVEAKAQQGRHVCVVGGGNSAGQAALHLARYAASVSLVIRGAALAASMSAYLIAQLEALGVRIVRESRIVGAFADDRDERLARIELENVATRERHTMSCQAVFITIGARPHTEWLPAEVLRDRWGFVFTGASAPDEDAPDPWRGRAVPGPLESSVPGLFAVGDARRSSVKRVASAVGEGSVVISAVHRHLARSSA